MDDIIKKYYFDNNYPNANKLFSILKKNNV